MLLHRDGLRHSKIRSHRGRMSGQVRARHASGFFESPELSHDAEGRIEYLLEVAKSGFVISQAAANYLACFFEAIGVSDLADARCGAGSLFVGEEVMAKPVKHRLGYVADVRPFAVGGIVLQYRNDLVVSFILVNHAETSDWDAFDKNVAMLNGPVCQHADVKRVAIALHGTAGFLRGECRDAFTAVGLGNKTIQGGADVGVLLRTIDFQVSGDLIDLVLQRIRRHNLDEALHDIGSLFSGRDSVPWMGFEEYAEQLPEWLSSSRQGGANFPGNRALNERTISSLLDTVYPLHHAAERVKAMDLLPARGISEGSAKTLSRPRGSCREMSRPIGCHRVSTKPEEAHSQ